MNRPLSPWIVSLLSFAAIITVLVATGTVHLEPAQAASSDFENGERLGRALGPLLIAVGIYFVQRRRVKRFEESQVRPRS